mmetsp:Transcript_36847/g.115331  ORF Transcript_36847/g.115331 Transcript_36847/m.115331 type:complete len:278 (+) Transcript_36847:137-970(+)
MRQGDQGEEHSAQGARGVPRGGGAFAAAEPPEHRGLQGELPDAQQGEPVHRDGVLRRRRPVRRDQEGAAAAIPGVQGAALVRADGAGAALHAQQPHPAPRPQDAEHLLAGQRAPRAGRPGHQQGARGHHGLRADLHRHAVLHEPGDLQEQAVQPQERHMGAGLRALRAHDAQPRLRRRVAQRPRLEDHPRQVPAHPPQVQPQPAQPHRLHAGQVAVGAPRPRGHPQAALHQEADPALLQRHRQPPVRADRRRHADRARRRAPDGAGPGRQRQRHRLA